MNRSSLVAGVGVGAGVAAYLLDPDRGARRRGRLRDVLAHSSSLTRHVSGRAARDVLHRTYGTVLTMGRAVRRNDVDDEVLIERVRAKLGRLVSHSHAVRVTAVNGVVFLDGPILTAEADRLVRGIGRVAGVHDVIDRLDRHDDAAQEPALQGGHVPSGDRLDIFQPNWSPATRFLVALVGTGTIAAAMRRRDAAGAVPAVLGVMALGRALTNLPTVATGTRQNATRFQKTITIDAPAHEVFSFWSAYENFPRFMSRVRDVRSNAGRSDRSHWKVAGPGGASVAFDAEVTHTIPNRLIAWTTVPGSVVAHAGVVRFDPMGDRRTRVQVRMSYNPPAGWVGHGVARIFGVDPKSSMDEDLARMKTLIETGRAPHEAARPITPLGPDIDASRFLP